ncbi:MAG: class IV adenylate cyclase [Spirochaetia bacterium]
MPFEIELKAWVDEPEKIIETLNERYRFIGEYEKSDIYYRAPKQEEDIQPQDFRLRTEGQTYCVTYKDKKMDKGMEINDEMEFAISNPSPFTELMRRLGCTVFCKKRKIGKRYEDKGIIFELSWIENLGYFLEVEVILDHDGDETVGTTKQLIRDTLKSLGIPENKIEPRYYTDLLSEKELKLK